MKSSESALSSVVATSHMQLLTFKLMKIKYDQTFSSSVAVGTFGVLSGSMWPGASVWVGAHREHSIPAGSSRDGAGLSHQQSMERNAFWRVENRDILKISKRAGEKLTGKTSCKTEKQS